MSRCQHACAAAGVAWIGMHVWHGITWHGHHGLRWLNWAALALCVALSAWAMASLATGIGTVSRREALLLTSGGAVVALAVIPLLDFDGVRSYANWPAGGLGVLIAALVIRRRARESLALVSIICATIVVAVTRTAGGLDIVWSTSLCVPPLLWFTGAMLARRIFDRTDESVRRLATVEAAAWSKEYQTMAVSARYADRRQELAEVVMPLLNRLARGGAIDQATRTRCTQLAGRLRDDLQARAIVDRELVRMAQAARERGVDVTIIDSRENHIPHDDRATDTAHALAHAALPQLTSGRFVLRVTADGSAVTLVVDSDPGALASIAATVTGLGDPQVDDGQLYLRTVVNQHDYASAVAPAAD